MQTINKLSKEDIEYLIEKAESENNHGLAKKLRATLPKTPNKERRRNNNRSKNKDMGESMFNRVLASGVVLILCAAFVLRMDNPVKEVERKAVKSDYKPSNEVSASSEIEIIMPLLIHEFNKADPQISSTCIHEAGHFVMCCLLGQSVENATCVANGDELGSIQQGLSMSNNQDIISASGYAAQNIFEHPNWSTALFIERKGCFEHHNEKADLYRLYTSDPVAAMLEIENAKALLKRLENKVKIIKVAAYLYKHGTLDDVKCKKLTNYIN